MNPRMVSEKRKFWKYLIFGILTLGIYTWFFMFGLIKDLNQVCSDTRGIEDDKSPNYLLVVLFAILTFGIYYYVWLYKQGNRIRATGEVMGVHIDEKGSTYLLWSLVGILLFGIGPLVSLYLFITNCNKLNRLYNYRILNESNTNTDFNQRSGNQPVSESEAKGQKASYWGWNDEVPTQGAKGRGTVRCIKGYYDGAVIELGLGDELIIGRSSAMCQLVIPDQDISRKHCSVKYSAADGYFYVIDYSTFGVVMNDSTKLEKNVVMKCPIGTKLSLGTGNNVFVLQ